MTREIWPSGRSVCPHFYQVSVERSNAKALGRRLNFFPHLPSTFSVSHFEWLTSPWCTGLGTRSVFQMNVVNFRCVCVKEDITRFLGYEWQSPEMHALVGEKSNGSADSFDLSSFIPPSPPRWLKDFQVTMFLGKNNPRPAAPPSLVLNFHAQSYHFLLVTDNSLMAAGDHGHCHALAHVASLKKWSSPRKDMVVARNIQFPGGPGETIIKCFVSLPPGGNSPLRLIGFHCCHMVHFRPNLLRTTNDHANSEVIPWNNTSFPMVSGWGFDTSRKQGKFMFSIVWHVKTLELEKRDEERGLAVDGKSPSFFAGAKGNWSWTHTGLSFFSSHPPTA